jgi:hypothetical protein
LSPAFVANIAKQAGFEYRIEENVRSMSLEFLAPDREVPLLLFDAADPGNSCWYTRCRFYADGRTLPNARRLQVFKELPTSFQLRGKQLLTEQLVYVVLYNLLNALMNPDVGVCGGPIEKPRWPARSEKYRRAELTASVRCSLTQRLRSLSCLRRFNLLGPEFPQSEPFSARCQLLLLWLVGLAIPASHDRLHDARFHHCASD